MMLMVMKMKNFSNSVSKVINQKTKVSINKMRISWMLLMVYCVSFSFIIKMITSPRKMKVTVNFRWKDMVKNENSMPIMMNIVPMLNP